jgi:hypothetical protein
MNAAVGRAIVFAQRHPWAFRLLPRSWVSRIVWWQLLSTPGARESIAQGEADIAAGRWYRFDTETRRTTPNPDWPKEGPQPRA